MGLNAFNRTTTRDREYVTHCKLCQRVVTVKQERVFLRRPLIGISHKDCYEKEMLSGRTDMVLAGP